MNLTSHANILPWMVEPAFFETLITYLLNGIAVAIAIAASYRLLHALLSHRKEAKSDFIPANSTNPDRSFTHETNLPMTNHIRERSHNEA